LVAPIVVDTANFLWGAQDAALEGWKSDAIKAVHESLGTLREEMTDRARLHGTISNERIAKMHNVAKQDAMSSAERQVWNTLGPQLVQANDRIAELEDALGTLRNKVKDTERVAASCVGSASDQSKMMLQQLEEMTEALEKKDMLWRRQRQRNVACEQRVTEIERQAAAAAAEAERRQRQYQADISTLNKTISSLDPSRGGGLPLKKIIEVVEVQLGLPVQVDTAMIIRLSACHRAIGGCSILAHCPAIDWLACLPTDTY
jgi:chromosome segregation ATPase